MSVTTNLHPQTHDPAETSHVTSQMNALGSF
jgi:hypothetical protein